MQWQKKLYQLEELPPPGIWEEMKKALADEPYQIRQSLNEYAVTPPVNVWENVIYQIEQKEIPVSVPFLHKFRRTTLSYAAAIIGIGLFTALLVFLFNNKPNTEDLELVKVKPVIASLNKPAVNSVSNKKLNESGHKPAKQKVSYSDGNYILLYENNGQPNRVSYKLSDMVQSLHNNEPSSGNTKEAAEIWNKKITAWKEKMGHSTFIPSASNFFDIAEMAEILNAEK
jgi:hypothetical protein